MLLGSLDVSAKVVVACAGAWLGIVVVLSAGIAWFHESELVHELLRHIGEGIPVGAGVLPWIALIWLGSAIAGAFLSLWAWRRLLRLVFGYFGRRLIDE